MGIYAALLQAMQNKNGGAQGFTAPGNSAPMLPTPMTPGASSGIPSMQPPQQPQGATTQPAQGGMFSQMANNPMLMKMMMGQQGSAGQNGQTGALPQAGPAQMGNGQFPAMPGANMAAQPQGAQVPTLANAKYECNGSGNA